jgi:hypothetical protein
MKDTPMRLKCYAPGPADRHRGARRWQRVLYPGDVRSTLRAGALD